MRYTVIERYETILSNDVEAAYTKEYYTDNPQSFAGLLLKATKQCNNVSIRIDDEFVPEAKDKEQHIEVEIY